MRAPRRATETGVNADKTADGTTTDDPTSGSRPPLAEFRPQGIELAEHEMPGLMGCANAMVNRNHCRRS